MMAYMILGGQWGSEGKGLFAGWMARDREPDVAVCQFGPNAGHTWIEGDRPIVFKSLPVASIAPSVRVVLVGPGAVVHPDTLRAEVKALGDLLKGKKVYVHEAAAIVRPEDVVEERSTVRHIASTMQGTSEAMVRKIRRYGGYPAADALSGVSGVEVVTHDFYRAELRRAGLVQIEGAQGMDLSINCGYEYPYVTSRDCTPAQVLADCAVHPMDLAQVMVCLRTLPIRVGHVTDAQGLRVGNSGPCYPDQREMTWEEVGVSEEYTTVTKRVRRIFSFSLMQTRKMLEELQPHGIFLNFMNYLPNEEAEKVRAAINDLAGRTNAVRWTGHGLRATDIRTHYVGQRRTPEYGEAP